MTRMDPDVLEDSKLNYNIFDWDRLRRLKELGVEHLSLPRESPEMG